MAETLEIFGKEYTNVAGIKATDNNGDTKTFIIPKLISKTVDPKFYAQVVTPNETQVDTLENITMSLANASQTNKTVALSIVTNETYRIEGTAIATPTSSSQFTVTFGGEWVCAYANNLPYTQSDGNHSLTFKLTPTSLSVTPGFSGTLELQNLRFFASDGTTYNGLSSVTVNAAPAPNIGINTSPTISNDKLVFSNLLGEPKMFSIQINTSGDTYSDLAIVMSVVFNGTTTTRIAAQYVSGSGLSFKKTTATTFTYSNGQLKVDTFMWQSSDYTLVYIY